MGGFLFDVLMFVTNKEGYCCSMMCFLLDFHIKVHSILMRGKDRFMVLAETIFAFRMNSFLFLERAVIEIKTIHYFPRALSYCSDILRNRNWIFTINKC